MNLVQHPVFSLSVLLSAFSIIRAVKILPFKIESPECSISNDIETCSLQGLDGVYRGKKHWKSPEKFVMLWPMPHGNYEKVRRLCHACDLEVAEVWDEDDANQIIDLLKSKNNLDTKGEFSNVSFWLGESQDRIPPKISPPGVPESDRVHQLRFFYQDKVTPVQFNFLRGQKSFAPGTSASSGLADDEKDCIVIGPDPKEKERISWFIQSCRSRSNFGVCQFKRKHHCYDEAPVPATRQLYAKTSSSNGVSVYKPQPYHLSNYPLTWALAKFACEKNNRSLLFFDSQDEEQFFTKAFGNLLKKKDYLQDGFWSAGQFQREKLVWRIGEERLTIPKYRSNEIQWNFGFSKPKNKKDKKSSVDFPYGESCVYFEGPSSKWGIAECEKSMRFFVCKDAETEFEKKSTVEYCDGKNYIKKERFECKWNLVLKKDKPSCVCVEGVHGLTDHASCNSRLLIGPKCIKLSQKGVVHWKILSQSLIEKDAWLIVQLRSHESGRFIEWFGLQQNSSRQLFGNANVYYSGLKAVQLDRSRICFHPVPSATNSLFYELKIRNATSTLEFAFKKCPQGTQPNFRVHKLSQSRNECELESCKSPKEPVVGSLALNSLETDDVHGDIPIESKSANEELNERMLAYKIDKAFGKAKPIDSFGPMGKILRKLMEIVKRLCSCLVNGSILDDALELFQVAYSGEAYRYVPSFTDSEAEEILLMMEKCQEDVETIPCETNECSGRALKVSEQQVTVDDAGIQGNRHHHVLEIVWLAISSMNVACVKHFKPSYLDYHHLQQSFENLFTGEMKKLWHYPSVDPNYFQMLLGPYEAIDLVNLKSCASAIQGINPKMMELLRPKQPKGKYLGERIRARKFKDENEARGYDALKEVTDIDYSNDGVSSNDDSKVFCSRDEFCLKW